MLRLKGADEGTRSDNYKAVQDELTEVGGGLTAKVGGSVGTETAINERVSSDIGRAEGMAMPILLVLLVLIFGGLVSASLPMLIGGIAILGSFTALHMLTYVTDVSIFAVNITTFLGLGLAIDYGLFMVSRFREEIGRGRPLRTRWPRRWRRPGARSPSPGSRSRYRCPGCCCSTRTS